MSLLDTAQTLLYRKNHGEDLLSLYQQVQQWLEDDGGNSRLWLPAKRLAPFGPLAILSPNFISRYEDSSNSSGWLRVFNVSWAAGQPSAEHDCLALDTKTSTMLTLPCDNALPFLTIIYMRKLFEVPNHAWKNATPGLITQNNLTCPGWSSEYPGGQEVCFTEYQNEAGLRWGEARELCEEKDAQLPDPSNGFLDWALRQYMFSSNESIWIRVPNPESNKTEGRRGIFLNWKAGTNHSLPNPALTSSGWIRHDSEVTKTHILCQKNILVPKSNIQVTESGKVYVAVQPPTETLPQCYVNGHWKPLIEPSGYAEETGSVTGSMVNSDSDQSDEMATGYEEPDPFTFSGMIVNNTNQGYYKCWVWTDSPPYLLLSNTLLHRQADTFTFVIVLSNQSQYIPELHDAAMNPETFSPDEPCMVQFRTQVQMEATSLNYTVNVTTENFYFSPEVQTNNLLFHFHVRFKFFSEILKSKENTAYEMISAAFSQLSKEDCHNVSARSTAGCHKETQENLTWPTATGGKMEPPIELCITEEGNPVTRECLGDFISGYYWGNKSGECTDQVSNRTRQLWNINQMNSSDSALLAKLTDHGHTLSAADVYFTAKKIQAIASESSVEPRNLTHVVKTINNVMEAEDKAIQQMQDDFNTSNTLLQALETISFKTKLHPDSREPKELCNNRLVSLARVSLMPNSSIIGYHSSRTREEKEEQEHSNLITKENKDEWRRSQVSLILPDNLTQQVAEYSTLNGSRNVQIMFAVYRNSKLFDDSRSFPNHTVDGHIIQAAYSDHTITGLEQPVKIYFKTRSTGNNSKCVFWDFMKNEGQGGWSTEGCLSASRHGDHVLCQCYHLTSFAHLLNFDKESLRGHEVILDTISIIGCVISIIALLMVLVTFFLFKKWRRRLSNQIVVSLASVVMLSLIVFLSGIRQTSDPTVCRAAAVTLHYFILASFGWMLVEAVHQYLRLVKVVGGYIPRFMMKASVCAWGIPLVPVIIVLAYDPSLYDSDRDPDNMICWMSSTAFTYAFLPPLTATMSINVVLFGLILYSTTCGRVQITSTQTERQRRIILLWMAICVFSLLGFTWLFGLLTFWYPNLVFSYLFCITSTTQGFFIFFFHVFREREARKLWKDSILKIGRDFSASRTSTPLATPKTSRVSLSFSAPATALAKAEL